MTILSQSYVFDPRPHYPLVITAKRHWKSGSPFLDDSNALTLIFTHGTGFHKEQWEPAIDDLFEMLEKKGANIKIREMWSIDCPNHGDAGVLNEKTLKWGYDPYFSWEEYARAIHTFLAGYGAGVDVDFSKRRMVGIGHSMGAVCICLAMNYFPSLKFESLILCELMTMNEAATIKMSGTLVGGAVNRRDIWPSREEAYKTLKSRPAWRAWDDRVLKKFVEDGMRPLPTLDYPDKNEGITLKCSRIQETACYRDPIGISRAYGALGSIVKRLPVHMIYGAIDDYLPRDVKDDVVGVAAGGVQNLASLARVERAGHLIIQMNPYGVAERIFDALVIISHSLGLKAKM